MVDNGSVDVSIGCWPRLGEQIIMIDGLLLGIIASTSVVASLFFLKFWRATRDFLFLAFAIAFAIEGFSRLIHLNATSPNEGLPEVYLARLIGYILILVAIISKNRQSS
jgi:hypothetical protein